MRHPSQGEIRSHPRCSNIQVPKPTRGALCQCPLRRLRRCARSACAPRCARRHAAHMSPPLTSVRCGWRHRLDDFVNVRAHAPWAAGARNPHQPDRGGADRLSSTGKLLAARTRSAPLLSAAALRFTPGATAPHERCACARRNEQNDLIRFRRGRIQRTSKVSARM